MEIRRSPRVPKTVVQPPDMEMREEKKVERKPNKNKVSEDPEIENQGKKVSKKRNSPVNNKKPITKKVKIEPEKTPEIEPERKVDVKFMEPIPIDEAMKRWPERYDPMLIEKRKQQIEREKERSKRSKKKGKEDEDEEEEILVVKCHYSKALVDGISYELNDDAHVKSDKVLPYICKIIEFFETVDDEFFFRAQWYYRPSDTVIREAVLKEDDDEEQEEDYEGQEEGYEEKEEVAEDKPKHKKEKKFDDEAKPKEDYSVHLHEKRIFISIVQDNNPLDLLLGKINIERIASNVDSKTKEAIIARCGYFYDLAYELPYKSFVSIPPENSSKLGLSTEVDPSKKELSLLDLYSGCGAMSTGLNLGADAGGLNLVTRWAVDINESACDTLRLNHPTTKVRNERAEDFLSLLQIWQELCNKYVLGDCLTDDVQGEELEEPEDPSPEEFVVESLVGISYGNPTVNAANLLKKDDEKKIKPSELYFKVHWKGYDSSEETWEPYSGLSNCEEQIRDFVITGYQSKILPLPKDVDVICGGPPCQGISGFNRFRNSKSPLDDEKNYQMLVYMNIVKFLNPDYILMENVVDLVKFADGFLARYAVRRLLSMDYQVRMGIMAAGSFGLPQFRRRVFVWGARIGKKIPPYPYPTHEVVERGNGVRKEFEQCLVAYDETTLKELKKRLYLEDALTDLPAVQNDAQDDQIPYGEDPRTDFQKFIRLNKEGQGQNAMLYDHLPYKLNEDDYQRVCKVPKKKEACFRDLGGVKVNSKGKWELDTTKPRAMLKSGKPLVPDYALTFCKGTSTKPFGRLWWDETVPTVVTRPEPHNQVITHPEQDRVLTVRENARLQGFPDYYRLCGSVKEKYIQVGNAVAVPVAKALGYTLAIAVKGQCNGEPLIELPNNFNF